MPAPVSAVGDKYLGCSWLRYTSPGEVAPFAALLQTAKCLGLSPNCKPPWELNADEDIKVVYNNASFQHPIV